MHWKSCDMITFQTSFKLLQQTELSMKAMNSVDQFWQIICQILKENCDNDKTYFDDIQINKLKMKYNNKNFLSDIQQYMFEYFQHIDYILVSIELADAKITKEKLYWCQNDIIIIKFVCDYNN